ncbi:MAG: hypothetical protein PUI29_11585 [Aeromonadales bacterium]|nr:hypothetical protein [Aeromonadales bacterium]MDY2891816.1 hypothetical protein [Succinivibrio sp.]
MRKFSLAALAVLSALSLAACNSTSTDEYNGAAEGPKGFKSAEVRFQAHPEAMTRHQADELSERTDDRHLFVFGSKDDDEASSDEKPAEQDGAKEQDGAAAATAAASAEKEADKAQRTEAGFKSSEIRFQKHPEQMTGQKAAPAKKELTAEQQAKLEAKRAEQAKREAENDKVAEESERTESGFKSAEPRYQWNPEEATGKPRSGQIVSREEKYRDAAKRAGVKVEEKQAATQKTEEELEAEAIKKESNKFGFRSAEPRYQWKPEDGSK